MADEFRLLICKIKKINKKKDKQQKEDRNFLHFPALWGMNSYIIQLFP